MGSVKDLTILEEPTVTKAGRGIFTFKDTYSVKDWGQMPDEIPNKGAALALMSAATFQDLHDSMHTGYIGLIEPQTGERVPFIHELNKTSNQILVTLVNQLPVDGNYVRYINPTVKNYMIPLEVITRRGLPKGSSVFRKIDRFKEKGDKDGLTGLLVSLGLDHEPKPGEMLPRPVLNFTTKYEERDRSLSWEDAWRISGLSYGQIGRLMNLQNKIDDVINEKAIKIGVKYWDGKREYLIDNDIIKFADVAGTLDEDRFTKDGIQLSKEPLRQANNDTEWANQVKAAKELAKDKGTDKWKHLVNTEPQHLEPELINLVSKMYQSVSNAWTGHKKFDVPSLEQVIDEIKSSPYVKYFEVA